MTRLWRRRPRFLDIEKVEDSIRGGLEDVAGVTVESVECPADVRLKKGASVTCQVTTVERGTITVEVIQRDRKGGAISWSTGDARPLSWWEVLRRAMRRRPAQ